MTTKCMHTEFLFYSTYLSLAVAGPVRYGQVYSPRRRENQVHTDIIHVQRDGH